MQRHDGEIARWIQLAYKLPVDDYGLDQEDHDEVVPLYTKAGVGNGPKAITSDYTNVNLFYRASKLYFNNQVQHMPPA